MFLDLKSIKPELKFKNMNKDKNNSLDNFLRKRKELPWMKATT